VNETGSFDTPTQATKDGACGNLNRFATAASIVRGSMMRSARFGE
jgi:hypothetical protein